MPPAGAKASWVTRSVLDTVGGACVIECLQVHTLLEGRVAGLSRSQRGAGVAALQTCCNVGVHTL